MKIALLADAYMPRWDGVSRFLVEIIPRLKEHHELKAIVPDYGPSVDQIEIKKIPLMRFSVNDYPFARFSKEVKKEIKESDLLFVNSLGPIGMLGLLHGKRMNKPIVTYVHAIDWEMWSSSVGKAKRFLRWMFRMYARWLYNKSSIILVPYPEVIDLLKNNQITKPNFAVVRLGVDTNKFTPVGDEQKRLIRKKYALDPDKKLFAYVGRISREKGIHTLIQAFELLQKDYPNCQLVIAGKGLPELILPLKEKKGIIYRDLNGDSRELLQAIDVFVLPSLTETTSLITLEAMSCEKPVIASSVGYIKQYIEDKKNGFLFNRENSSQLRLKMQYVLEHYKELEELKKAARKTVVQRFNWDTTVNQIAKIFSDY